jgi:hypothetical protein
MIKVERGIEDGAAVKRITLQLKGRTQEELDSDIEALFGFLRDHKGGADD